MIRLINGWELPLKGHGVTVSSDKWSVTLLFKKESNGFTLHIEVPFSVENDSKKLDIDMGGDPANSPLAVILADAIVEEAVAWDDGSLALGFNDRRIIRIPGSKEFESWSIVGSNGLRIVSTPNCELEIWGMK